MQAAIEKLGIHAHRRCRFTGWNIKGSRVVSLKFMSPLHAFRIRCFALFYYGLKAIDIHAFRGKLNLKINIIDLIILVFKGTGNSKSFQQCAKDFNNLLTDVFDIRPDSV